MRNVPSSKSFPVTMSPPSKAYPNIQRTSMLDIIQPSPGQYVIKSTPSPLWSCFVLSSKVHNTSDSSTISFSASRVETFKQYMVRNQEMSYQDAYRLIIGLHHQLVELNKHHMTIPIFAPLGIILVDGRGYIADPSLVSTLENDKVHIKELPSDTPFIPPELQKSSKSGWTVNNHISLYTLAALCGAAMFPNWKDDANYSEMVSYLSPIKNTSLYWCLLRCLENNATDRVFLFV